MAAPLEAAHGHTRVTRRPLGRLLAPPGRVGFRAFVYAPGRRECSRGRVHFCYCSISIIIFIVIILIVIINMFNH